MKNKLKIFLLSLVIISSFVYIISSFQKINISEAAVCSGDCITITKIGGTGTGVVTSTGGSGTIDCGSSCANRQFDYGNTVNLIATPNAGSMFMGFTGDLGCEIGIISMDGAPGDNYTCNAKFNIAANTLPSLSLPQAAYSITQTSAVLSGTVNSPGYPTALTAVGTCYGLSLNPTTNCLSQGTSPVSFTQTRTGLTAGTTYHYRAYAVNSFGTGYSADSTFTTSPTIPAAPTGLAVSAGTCGQTFLNISWNSSPTATSYKLYRGTTLVYNSTGTSFQNTGLTLGSSYTYKVSALNAAGESAYSANVSKNVASACPLISITATPDTGPSGFTPTIAWNSSDPAITSCSVSPQPHSGLSGSFVSTPITTNSAFTLSCNKNVIDAYYAPLVACFTADTLVALSDGTLKNIQDIKIGDILKGETTNNKVLGFHRPILDGKLYSLNGGRYFVTEEHPFKTIDGWKSINPEKTQLENIGITVTELNVGDILITEKGNILLETIDSKEGASNTELFNFLLDGDHTYYADGYLVHNKTACDLGNLCGGTDRCINPATHLLADSGECAPCPGVSGTCLSGYTASCGGETTMCSKNTVQVVQTGADVSISNTAPVVTVTATPPLVVAYGPVTFTWNATNISGASYCVGYVNNILNSALIPNNTTSGSSTYYQSTSPTTYKATCTNEIPVAGTCSGTYTVQNQICEGSLGGNTCGFPDTDDCSQFTAAGCYVTADPWCHHNCHVETAPPSTFSCVGLNQSSCNSYSSCTWSGGSSSPMSASATATVQISAPTCSLSNNGPLSFPGGVATLTLNSTSADGCTLPGTSSVGQSSGTFTTNNISATTTYTATCSGPSSPAATCNTTVTVSPGIKDLTASIPTPTNATTGVATTFSSTITNLGNISTGTGFTSLFQTSASSTGASPTNYEVATSVIGPSGTVVINKSITFPIPGTYYMRVCADNNSLMVGTISESNEGNNCSSGTPWTTIIVSDLQRADLTASAPTPNTAIAGAATNFSSTISNVGNFTTEWSSTATFTFATAANGGGTLTTTDYITPIVLSGGTKTAIVSHTFPSAGIYSAKVCADSGNDVVESNEANNCSAWTNITVSPAPYIDLVASSPTPAAATIGTPIQFVSSITNNGNTSTGGTFSNIFQLATGANGTGTTSMLSSTPSPMPALAAGASATATSASTTYSGSPRTVSVRTCADNNAVMVGTISESNEGNNCSAWTNVPLVNPTFTLNITKIGSGTVNSNPSGIDCGLDCAEPYITGTSVTLVAIPISGWSFTGWSGGGCFGNGGCIVNMNSNLTVNATFTSTPLVPDLTTSVVTPTTALVGTPTVFSATVSNIGTGSTVAGFNNILQWSDINTPLIVNTIAAKSMTALAAGASDTYTQSLKFDNPGQYNARVCADKSNAGDVNGAITESNENNNCGAWVIVTVGGSPDLTAGNITPTSATVGVSTIFSSTISNIGNDTTGVAFYNIVQWFNVVTPATITTTVKKSMGILVAGATNVYTQDIKFTAVGQYNVRACADKSTALDANGLVSESDENNNCSAWTTVTISDPVPAITVSISATPPGPLTAPGATNLSWVTTGTPDSCDATGVDWSGINIINGTAVTQRSGMPEKTYVFGIVCHKAGELDAIDSVTVVVKPALPGPISVSISATPPGPLTAPGATNLSWVTTGTPDSCDATGVDWSGINIINGTAVTQRINMPNNTYVFGIVCHKAGETDAVDSVTVVVGTGAEINGIDLTASTPANAIVQVNDSRTYTSNITNLGNTGTGVKFPNVFRVSTIGEGDPNPTKYPTTPDALMPALDALSSDTASFSHSFNIEGNYYISACADKNTSMSGDITEVEEGNNCSGWATVQVIPIGNVSNNWTEWSTCSLCDINGQNGTQTRSCLPPPPPTGTGTNNCLPDINDNTTSKTGCTCLGVGGELITSFKATPSTIYKGKSSTLTWTTDPAVTICTGVGFDTEGQLNGSKVVYPVINTPYKLRCNKGGPDETKDAKVKVININIIEG
jgi:hypothetical protein